MTKIKIIQPGGAVFYGCECLQAWWPVITRLAVQRGYVKRQIRVTQGSYNTSVKASAKTHWGGGVVDIEAILESLDDLLEECGAASFQRDELDHMVRHTHVLLIGCPHLHWSAANQVKDWKNKKNGLVNKGADRDKTRPARIRTWREGMVWALQQLKLSEEELTMSDVNTILAELAAIRKDQVALRQHVTTMTQALVTKGFDRKVIESFGEAAGRWTGNRLTAQTAALEAVMRELRKTNVFSEEEVQRIADNAADKALSDLADKIKEG